MTGFTPINARAISAPTPVANDASKESKPDAGRQKTTRRRQPARKKAAPPDTENQATNPEPAPKRISGKGRKRTNDPGEEPGSKRRKSGSVGLNMPITKTGAKASEAKYPKDQTGSNIAGTSSTDAETISLASKSKLDGFRFSNNTAAETSTCGSKSTTSHHVYMPQTSMDSINQAQPQTTMQAVQSSQAGGSTLYSSSIEHPTTGYSVISTPAFTRSTALPAFNRTAGTLSNLPQTQLPTPVNSDTPTEAVKPSSRRSKVKTPQTLEIDFEDFDNLVHEDHEDDDEDETIELAKRIEQSAASKETSPPARARKFNIRETHEYDDYGGALFTEEERELLDSIKLPQDARRPIVRSKFPMPIMDRTSLSGVSNTSALRTCFRVGEALNTGCHAVRNNRNLILELYARVTSSWRDEKPSRKQHFVIHDLYHDKPPFINGTFELWDQSTLWDEDSRPFLDASASGMMCRMIAKMKRDGGKWRLEILSIWPADWDDVEHAAEIYTNPVIEESS